MLQKKKLQAPRSSIGCDCYEWERSDNCFNKSTHTIEPKETKGGLAKEFNLLQKHASLSLRHLAVESLISAIWYLERGEAEMDAPAALFSIRTRLQRDEKEGKLAPAERLTQCNSEGLCFETCRRERTRRAESLNLIWSRALSLTHPAAGFWLGLTGAERK